MKALYTAHAHATGGREGSAATDDAKVDVKLSTPKELGGGGGAGTNPEQLFAAGYAACFLGAIKFVAGKDKITVSEDSKIESSVGIGPRDDGTGFGLGIRSKRYAMLVEDGVVKKLNLEAMPGKVEVSGGDTLLGQL